MADSPDGMTILAVEDDVEALDMLSMILRDRGARLWQARDYAEALQCLDKSRPDVLISDVGPPGLDGYALIEEIRRRETDGSRRLPAIALTAFARRQDREAALAAGFDAHCAKPFSPNELIDIILRVNGSATE